MQMCKGKTSRGDKSTEVFLCDYTFTLVALRSGQLSMYFSMFLFGGRSRILHKAGICIQIVVTESIAPASMENKVISC